MELIVIGLFTFSTVLTLAAFLWVRRQWAGRGGLRVVLFRDRLSKNFATPAAVLLGLCLGVAYGVFVAGWIAGSVSSLLPATTALFTAPAVLTVWASVEGLYGKGLYQKRNGVLTLIDAQPITVLEDQVCWGPPEARETRSFVASRKNRRSLETWVGESPCS